MIQVASPKRTKSLNPNIYPSWWGDPTDAEHHNVPKSRALNKEKSLEQKLAQAKAAADNLDKMFLKA